MKSIAEMLRTIIENHDIDVFVRLRAMGLRKAISRLPLQAH